MVQVLIRSGRSTMIMNIHNIHMVGVHSMNFCSQIVGAVRETVKSSSYISWLSFLTVKHSEGELYLQTNQQSPG